MKNLTIGKRITIGFASVIMIAVILGSFAYNRLIAIQSHSERITKQCIPTLEQAARARKNALESTQIVYKHIGSSDKEDMARLEAALAAGSVDNGIAYETLERLITSEKGHAALDRVKAARSESIKPARKCLWSAASQPTTPPPTPWPGASWTRPAPSTLSHSRH